MDAGPSEVDDAEAPASSTCSVVGHLLDEHGKRLATPPLTSILARDSKGLESRAKLDPSGRFVLQLEDGKWTLAAQLVGFACKDLEVEVDSRQESQAVALVLVPTSRVVLARVSDTKGIGVEEWLGLNAVSSEFAYLRGQLNAVLTSEPLLEGEIHRADRDPILGKFKRSAIVEEGVIGWLDVPLHETADAVALLWGGSVVQTKRVPVAANSVQFVLDRGDLAPGTVSLEVLDPATGTPPSLGSLSITNGPQRTTIPIKNGELRIALAPCLHRLTVTAAGCGQWTEEIHVSAGIHTDLGQVLLEPAFKVGGSLMLPSGESAGSALVCLTRLSGGQEEDYSLHTTFGDGSFLLSLPSGEYVMHVEDGLGSGGEARFVVRSADVEGLVLAIDASGGK